MTPFALAILSICLLFVLACYGGIYLIRGLDACGDLKGNRE